VVTVLLEAGVNIDRQDEDGINARMIAAVLGDTALLKLLVEHAPPVNLRDREGRTALAFATWKGHLRAVSVLLEAGAS
jgi:uncharacterized protein